jgi:hypothetical protein
MRKFVKPVLMVLLALLVFLVGSYGYLFLIRSNDFRRQERHLAQLEARYQSGHTAADELLLVDVDLSDESIQLNRLRLLGSHNSYKKTGPAVGRLFIALGANVDEARALRYGYRTLTEQFESGIRSLEWDVRLRRGRFELTHVPIVDHASVAPDVEGALEELRLYSVHHPRHLPLVILMEIKSDWMMLDPALQPVGTAELRALDQLIEGKLSDRLHRPRDLLAQVQSRGAVEPGMSLRQAIQAHGWPSLAALLGKVIFVLHAGDLTTGYYEADRTFQTQTLFPSVYATGVDRDYAAFVVHNTPDPEVIGGLVRAGFIVRTRIDADLVFRPARFEDAWRSGAQILTSDFTVGRSDLPAAAVIYLPGNKTAVLGGENLKVE